MEIIKHSKKQTPKISLILLDWSVRESFHLLDYLAQQNVPNEWIEIILVEFYSRKNPKMTEKQREMLDCWIVMNMPTNLCYHKHLMYNCGILHAQGQIITICDSDMMVKPSFIASILDFFEHQQNAFLHLDQHRSENRKYYPFNYPSFEELDLALDPASKTLLDPFHQRNYGACFCARKEDILAIGGADEHLDYAGHICGPYDLSIRLINSGKKEVWHNNEFSYHTWHPGSGGVDNYFGPHDGLHFSSTSINYFINRQIKPHLANHALKLLGSAQSDLHLFPSSSIINPDYYLSLDTNKLRESSKKNRSVTEKISFRQNSIASINASYLLLLETAPRIKKTLLLLFKPSREVKHQKYTNHSASFKKLAFFLKKIDLFKTRWFYLRDRLLKTYGSMSKINSENTEWIYFVETTFEKFFVSFLLSSKNIKTYQTKQPKAPNSHFKQKKIYDLGLFMKYYSALKENFTRGEISVK